MVVAVMMMIVVRIEAMRRGTMTTNTTITMVAKMTYVILSINFSFFSSS